MRLRASRALSTLVAAMQTIGLTAVALALADCGGSSNSNPTPPIPIVESTNYTVGGTITGLTVGNVVLANGTATVSIAAGTSSWVFPVSFAPGSSYSVAVQTQPSGEQCEVTGGASGMNTGNVGNVTVVCGFGQWTWEGGSKTVNAAGVYGTLSTAAASNLPGARYSASSWTDSSGNFWLFGGVGYDLTGGSGYLNDLWQYSPSTGQWTWEGGLNTLNANGVYGTQGTAAAGNLPGARDSASSWTDSSGNLWLFGGVGYSAAGSVGNLNDLWRYSPSTGQWAWISGGNANNAVGVYGTQGTAAAGNVPGARYSASAWTDSSGNLWLFGGYGYDSTGAVGKLNDLWQYSPSTGQWTWISGEDAANATGAYGALGIASILNLPGARQAASAWTDSSGNFWLFGGIGYASTGGVGNLNDLWQYSPSTKEWTWASGGSADNATGIYGTQGAGSLGNVPGGRDSVSSWIDSSGNFWLFGGYGYDSTADLGYLNDLWQYKPGS
jgi:N-acetylneuraminic acid mutarotase